MRDCVCLNPGHMLRFGAAKGAFSQAWRLHKTLVVVKFFGVFVGGFARSLMGGLGAALLALVISLAPARADPLSIVPQPTKTVEPVETAALQTPVIPVVMTPSSEPILSDSSPSIFGEAVSPVAPDYAPKPLNGREKINVVIFGDSLGDGVWAGLYHLLRSDRRFNVIRRSRVATGFVRQDYFNWNDEVRAVAAETRIDIAIIVMGTNDRQTIVDGRKRYALFEPKWREIYEARIDAFTARVLRRHVASLAHERIAEGVRGDNLVRMRDAEIAEFHLAFEGHEHVRRRHIPVHNSERFSVVVAAAVRVVEALQDLDDECCGEIRWKRDASRGALAKEGREINSFDVVHRDVQAIGLAPQIEHLHDVRVVKAGRKFCLKRELVGEGLVASVFEENKFDHRQARCAGIGLHARQINLGHAATTDEVEQRVATKTVR